MTHTMTSVLVPEIHIIVIKLKSKSWLMRFLNVIRELKKFKNSEYIVLVQLLNFILSTAFNGIGRWHFPWSVHGSILRIIRKTYSVKRLISTWTKSVPYSSINCLLAYLETKAWEIHGSVSSRTATSHQLSTMVDISIADISTLYDVSLLDDSQGRYLQDASLFQSCIPRYTNEIVWSY